MYPLNIDLVHLILSKPIILIEIPAGVRHIITLIWVLEHSSPDKH